MPRGKPAPGKRPRASKTSIRAHPGGWAACPPRTRDDLIRDMTVPMNEAMALMQALHLMGRGMADLGRDEGDAVMAVAAAARDRLQIVDDTWLDFIQATH